ncbi:glycosyltransferase family 4 protein [Caulobacter sp. KR2-114]|uniref:glycosyltransferase family 4 protein n=1 Tax=Caulobacter sp. KR2-114 TaxID=3400912 RepID=UPI003BFCFF78
MAETPAFSALPDSFTLLQVTPELDGGGVEAVTLDVAAAVAAAGRRSLVASRGGALEGRLAAAGAQLFRAPVQSKNPLTLALNAIRLERLIRRERVSLVHVRSRAPAFSALAAARRTRVPLVATYHGIYRADGALKRWYNAVMTRGDLVIANSAFTQAHVLAEHAVDPGKVAVIPEGVDTDVFDPARVSAARVAAIRQAWGLRDPEPRAVILLAGRLTRLKGQRLLVEAAGRLGRSEEMMLVLAGGGGSPEYRDEILAAAAVTGLGDNLRLVGPVEDMPAAYLAADLVVAPSTQPESFGRTVAEAGAMGRPVLAAAHGGPAEIVVPGQTGWLARPGDGDAWTAALAEALATSPERRAAMAAAARRRVKQLYSLRAMCEATGDVYRRLLEARE